MQGDWVAREQRSIRITEIINHGLHRQTDSMAGWIFEQGHVSVFFTAADWSDGERRAAVAQIWRLNGVHEVYDFSEPSLKAKRGKDSDAKTKGGRSRKAPS